MSCEGSDNNRFTEWLNRMTAEEFRLLGWAYQYQKKYFADLRLIAPSIRRKLLRYETKIDGQWVPYEDDVEISIEYWIFLIREIDGEHGKCLGRCNYRSKTVTIAPNLSAKDTRNALLHEMIHLYEFQLAHEYREWLTLNLYQRLCRRISPAEVNRYVNSSNHIFDIVPGHGVLFLLKSLDLDIRFKWKLGTVFGYGRHDYFPKKR